MNRLITVLLFSLLLTQPVLCQDQRESIKLPAQSNEQLQRVEQQIERLQQQLQTLGLLRRNIILEAALAMELKKSELDEMALTLEDGVFVLRKKEPPPQPTPKK